MEKDLDEMGKDVFLRLREEHFPYHSLQRKQNLPQHKLGMRLAFGLTNSSKSWVDQRVV